MYHSPSSYPSLEFVDGRPSQGSKFLQWNWFCVKTDDNHEKDTGAEYDDGWKCEKDKYCSSS